MIDTSNEDKELRIGDIVGHTNRTVIALTKMRERVENDSYASWIAICTVPFKLDAELHPYVVWTVIARPEGWSCENGNYCLNIDEAVTIYKKRGGEA